MKSFSTDTTCRCWLLLWMILTAGQFMSQADPRQVEKELAVLLSQFRASRDHYDRGRRQFASGQLDEAAHQFEACTAKMAGHVFAHYYLANIQYMRQKFPEALAAITEAEKNLDLMMEVDAYAQKQKSRETDKAIQELEKQYDATISCRELRRMEEVFLQLTKEEQNLRDMKGRQDLFQSKLKSDYAYFHGNILFQLKKYDEALDFFHKAITANPFNGNGYNNIIAIYYLAGQYENANRYIEAAEKAGIGEAVNLKLKVMVFEALGKTATGILEQEYVVDDRSGYGVVRFTSNVNEGETNRPPLFVNAYVAYDRQSRDAVLVDPGAIDPRIEDFVGKQNLKVRAIINTHGHEDHSRGSSHYARLYGVKISVLKQDSPFYGQADLSFLGTELHAGSIAIAIYHTPGHTAGSACFLIGPYFFTGDSLFEDTVGRIKAASLEESKKKMARLISELQAATRPLPDETLVLPGHGQSFNLGRVRASHPFLKKEE